MRQGKDKKWWCHSEKWKRGGSGPVSAVRRKKGRRKVQGEEQSGGCPRSKRTSKKKKTSSCFSTTPRWGANLLLPRTSGGVNQKKVKGLRLLRENREKKKKGLPPEKVTPLLPRRFRRLILKKRPMKQQRRKYIERKEIAQNARPGVLRRREEKRSQQEVNPYNGDRLM